MTWSGFSGPLVFARALPPSLASLPGMPILQFRLLAGFRFRLLAAIDYTSNSLRWGRFFIRSILSDSDVP